MRLDLPAAVSSGNTSDPAGTAFAPSGFRKTRTEHAMNENRMSATPLGSQVGSAAETILRQIVTLARRIVPVEILVSGDGLSFVSTGPRRDGSEGILSIVGNLVDGPVIVLKVEICRAAPGCRVSPEVLFGHLSAINEKCRVVAPVELQDSHQTSLCVELRVQPVPMSVARAGAFLSELKNLDNLAKAVQSEMPRPRTDAELVKLYHSISEYVEPVFPWGDGDVPAEFLDWAATRWTFSRGLLRWRFPRSSRSKRTSLLPPWLGWARTSTYRWAA